MTDMLRYTEICLSRLEIPGEAALCIYLSGCQNRCQNCHYPLLQSPDFGDPLKPYIRDMITLYRAQATCVCFMGEGRGTEAQRQELIGYAELVHQNQLKAALYSGRDTGIEPWMCCFDYIKLGSYREEFGALDSPHTNQKLYWKDDSGYSDITSYFWR